MIANSFIVDKDLGIEYRALNLTRTVINPLYLFIFAKGIKFFLVFPYKVFQFGYSVGRFLQYIRCRELFLYCGLFLDSLEKV